jgi:sucrose-6-phosphatase
MVLMSPPRLLLCTDMDRTVIPNGHQPEHPAARACFKAFCQLPEVSLVYVTGRHRELVEQAIQDYGLPEPDYAVTDVGTKLYRVVAGRWQDMCDWAASIAADWQGKSREQLQQCLSPMTDLTLQEPSKQNTFKISYYVSLAADKDELMRRAAAALNRLGVAASLVWSIDELAQIGLLDVLPRHATKLHGIRFLQRQLGYQPDEVLFAGDSGNDLPVLGSAIRSVLVANASDEIKRQARQLAAQNGHSDALYLAEEQMGTWCGNYTGGILQGVWHFAPEFRDRLRQVGFSL